MVPPLLQQLVVLLVQVLQFHGLILHQQVTFFVLQNMRHHCQQQQTECSPGTIQSEGLSVLVSHLKLLQLPDVALTLAHQLPHLVLVLVLLVEPLCLLPLVLLLRELTKTKRRSGKLSRRRKEERGCRCTSRSWVYLFDLLPVL